MKRLILAASLAALAGAAQAQTDAQPAAQAQPSGRVVAFDRPETQAAAGAPILDIASPDAKPGLLMPQSISAYGKNISPPISWSAGPERTKTYVLIVQDPDAQDPGTQAPEPMLHWLAYNIPASVHALNRAAKNMEAPTSPLGMLQGWNSHGSVGYTGPHPPVGAPAHHYVFQVYALDRKLGGAGGWRLDRVLAGMRGHVLARGDLTALYAEPAPKPPAAAPAGNGVG